MTPLETSIIQTLAYFDLYDYPLTFSELYHYLWQPPRTSLEEVIHTVHQMPQVTITQGCITLRGREDIVQTRNYRYVLTDQKFKKRRRYIRLLSLLPEVEAIFVVNSMSYHNAQVDSDIDLLIITKPGTIWSTRFFTTTLAKLLHLRPRPNNRTDALCLSFYLDTQHLNLVDLRYINEDMHQAYWLAQWLPIYDPQQLSNQYLQANAWLKDFLPHLNTPQPHPELEITPSFWHTLTRKIMRPFRHEQLWKKFQLAIMPQRLQALSTQEEEIVLLKDYLLKFHTTDPRPELKLRWEQTVEKYSIL